MKQYYAPGCALMIYKPHLTEKIAAFLNNNENNIPTYLTCCRKPPKLKTGSQIINTCAGCDKRYSQLYEGITTISLWELLADSETFLFPNYKGKEMTIHDACPTRNSLAVHTALRKLLKRMNIKLIEPKNTGSKANCCGDKFYGILPIDQVKQQMKKRANEMPCEDVVVYCVSCIKAMHIGGKEPRYIVDLLFNEPTTIGTFEPDEWHKELQDYIDNVAK